MAFFLSVTLTLPGFEYRSSVKLLVIRSTSERFLLHDAMQSTVMRQCVVCLSVRPSAHDVLSVMFMCRDHRFWN